MSAIIELRNPSDPVFIRVKKVIEEAGYKIAGDSANYIAIRTFPSSHRDTGQTINALTEEKYKGVLIPPNRNLENSKNASGRIAMVFEDWNAAQYGLATMVPALKYELDKKKKK
jgi:hypothetical protein